MPAPVPAPAPASRAGRNLPVAIAVGLALAAVLIASLYARKAVFVGVLVLAIGVGIRELVRAVRTTGANPPLVPLVVGGAAMGVLAYAGGAQALLVALVLTVLACLVWRLPDGGAGYLRDLAAGTLVAVYVPFLAGFAALLLIPPDGPRRVTVFIATVVCSDVGGYAAGALFGRHPMAPSVSPKKSWEGLVGSVLACSMGGALMVRLLLHGAWWQGLVFGLAVVLTATVGDLGESMVKRDIGIKDMGTLLPGHGGLMDRLDSLLPTAPVAWLLLSAFVPHAR
ncbi:MAG: phosphatidate cytidylyltransferase [Actinomycetota bacterium]|nr:phosphatidate cytidylyltransferase [Actinomycetota bacterium]